MRETIDRRLEVICKLEIESGRVSRGCSLTTEARSWTYWDASHRTCVAGLSGSIALDFRRTAARNLIAAGVDPFKLCQLVGWEGRTKLKQHNIIHPRTPKRRVAKLLNYLDEQKVPASKVNRDR